MVRARTAWAGAALALLGCLEAPSLPDDASPGPADATPAAMLPGRYEIQWLCMEGCKAGGAPFTNTDRMIAVDDADRWTLPFYRATCETCRREATCVRDGECLACDGIPTGAAPTSPYRLCPAGAVLAGELTWTGPPGPPITKRYRVTARYAP